jgi:spore coat protein U-like protein
MNTLNRFSLISLLLAGSLASSVTLAADSLEVTVTANVVGACKFNTGAIDFHVGDLDPAAGGLVETTLAGSPTFWCTKGVAFSLSDDKGGSANRLFSDLVHATDPTETIAYELNYVPSSLSAQGPSIPIDLVLTARIAEVAYLDSAVGAYSDTVTITITP